MNVPREMPPGLSDWDRAWLAAEMVRDRARCAAALLKGAGLPYAIVGGNAIAYWVARVDPGAVRNTPDVDVLVRRPEYREVQRLLTDAGFHLQPGSDPPTFVEVYPRQPLHVLFAGEKFRPDDPFPAPDLNERVEVEPFAVLNLEALVRMKLTSLRLHDRVHIRDLLDVGLLNASWLERLPSPLSNRLKTILDTPNG